MGTLRADTWRRTVAWRRAQLEAARLDAALAERLAADPRWDLHALLELVDRGCPPRLAVRILAPQDWQDPVGDVV